ncbi:MAG: hypothetical protein E7496_05645 [Ruminococcus sp.]|nr:hypothetical protein [Ruminococcus sp.]
MNIDEIINQLTHPEDVTDQFYPEDISTNQVSGILASFSVLFWLPLVIAKDSPYAKFCANQGLTLFALEAVLGIATKVLGWIPIIGWIVSLVACLATLGTFLLLLISACQKKARKIPFIGNMIQAFQ